MPIYDWRCEKCKHDWNLMADRSESSTPPEGGCPECKSDEVRRVITRPNISFSMGWGGGGRGLKGRH